MNESIHKVTVPVAPEGYEVVIGPGIFRDDVGPRVAAAGLGRKCALITDSIVGPLHADNVAAALRAAEIDVEVLEIPAGEASKCLAVAEDCCRRMIRAGLDRKSWVLALGGGVVGDLAGFVAAIYYRGIPCVQAPTTIVAMVDSSVGGKTGVNAPEGKNLIGAFHQPAAVWADTTTLGTLPDREFNEGMAEAIKHAALRDPDMLADLLRIEPGRRTGLESLIARNVAIKAGIVVADEKETLGLRALLNFGHTIGHAIETEAGYGALLHGEAIALGLRAALFLSERKAGLEPWFSRRMLDALAHYRLPLVLPDGFSIAGILSHLAKDKKFEAGAIRFVLLRAPGDAFVAGNVTAEDLSAAIDHLREPV